MRRYLLAAVTLVGTLFLATAGAYAGLGGADQVKGPWHLSPVPASHLAASQDVSNTLGKALNVQLLLVPQSISAALRQGVKAQVTSNQPANGIVSIAISRTAAKQAGLNTGRGASVVIGQGTVSQIKNGTVTLSMKLSRAIVNKLARLQHLALTLRLTLVAASGQHLSVGVVGRY
jgi:hypothetical protein